MAKNREQGRYKVLSPQCKQQFGSSRDTREEALLANTNDGSVRIYRSLLHWLEKEGFLAIITR